MTGQQESLARFFEIRFMELLDHIDFLTKERDNEVLTQLRRQIADVRRSLDEFRENGSSVVRVTEYPSPLGSQTQEVSVVDDAMYVALEDYFRGNPAEIAQRQKQYIPYVATVVDEEHPLLDIGCGRGEWLELLASAGIPARGIDTNRISVDEACERGLQVELGDVLTVLRAAPRESLGAITLFQVMEHLPFPMLVETFRLAVGALRPGGILIAEIPNTETLAVGATTFWIDPTHQRPLFPGILKFLASEVGFSSIDSVYSTPLAAEPELLGIPEPDRSVLLKLFRRIDGPGDFALIAKA